MVRALDCQFSDEGSIPFTHSLDSSAIIFRSVKPVQRWFESNPPEHRAVAQRQRRVISESSILWPYRIEVITSGCLPENRGSIPRRVAKPRHVSNFSSLLR